MIRKEKYNDAKLWNIFSIYIRLRDADYNGVCRCITCNHMADWRKMDCGHGIGRQYKAVKYHEWNNHAQCGQCNLDGGRQDVYKAQVNNRYGPNAWDLLLLASRQVFRKSSIEFEILTKHFRAEVDKLRTEKSIYN